VYSPLVIDQNLARLVKQTGIQVERHSIDESLEMARTIKLLVDTKTQNYIRALSSREKKFIKNETILCRLDFRYFAERYGSIALDASAGGGIGPIQFWSSQERALIVIARREEMIRKEFALHGFSDGILTIWHKSRQLGATAIMRLITLHRMLFYKHTRSIAGSLDIDKIHELYVRDKTILDNLPPFLAPKIEYDVKDAHIAFETLKSRLTYQQANQRAGVGTGQQFDISHMTEVSNWEYAERLKFDFLPAVPQSPSVFVAFESTANGRGNFWHVFSENVRKQHEGFQSWTYIFTPWYIERKKYRRIPPPNWAPNEVTLEHAALVERTSPEFTGGQTVILGKDQLYWWETEYTMHKQENSLHIFLSNYCATPEQSFQHSTRSALPLETIEWMRSTATMGMPYMPDVSRRQA
jgi:hypothetical protein